MRRTISRCVRSPSRYSLGLTANQAATKPRARRVITVADVCQQLAVIELRVQVRPPVLAEQHSGTPLVDLCEVVNHRVGCVESGVERSKVLREKVFRAEV